MSDIQVKNRWTVAELLAAEFPEPKWIIPDLLPAGLSILGGRPKMGKSYFMLQTACAVGSGGKILNRDVEKGRVLYLALEDSAGRLKKRIREMGIPADTDITFQLNWPPFQGKGIEYLSSEIEKNGFSLVVVDTFARAIPGVDQDKAEIVGPLIARLQGLTTLHNNGIALIDHTRKPSGMAADPIDDIMSSTAKTAVADAIFAFYREQGKAGAVLKGRGRDIEEVDIRMIWDRLTYSWQNMENSDEADISERKADILKALAELGKSQVGPIAKAVHQDASNTRKRLNDMVNAGLLSIEFIDGNNFYSKK